MKTVLFFSSVKDVKLFGLTGFYVEDIKVLENVGYKVKSTNKISDFFKIWNYDIAFLYFYKISFIPALLARLAFKKVIYTGGIDELCPGIIAKRRDRIKFQLLFKLNYLLSTFCNIVSKTDMENAKLCLNNFPKMSNAKLSYFPHSIDTVGYMEAEGTSKENIITTICWMASVGNVKRKGVDRTLAFFKKVLERNSEYKLYIIGTQGAGSDYLKELISEYGIEKSVFFTGEISEEQKISYLDRSKFYLQLSTYEGFGIAVVEAMMLRNYIFHTAVGGLKDTVGERGYVVEDRRDYFDSLEVFFTISNNYNDYCDLLEENRKFIIDQFSREARINYFRKLIIDDDVKR